MIVIAGLALAGFSGYEWMQSSQSVESIDEKTESTEELQPEASEPDPEPAEEKEAESPDPSKTYDFAKGEEIAAFEIPSIDSRFEVFWGTDDATLDQGVGMYVSDEWTETPNVQKHTVLSGHRDTVFTELGDVEEDDVMHVEFDGWVYEYKIDDIWITDAEDRTVIVEKEDPVLTVTTCYPFDYIGAAPDRYIMQGELVDVYEK
ncbi:class D sortase [Salicibibacter kimchii]|uniref:Class D sortase n=1 Tax=Salicibibacter kimchii TaxID=2099786 RepID=A0A345BZ68_9BACI|nr:class D sortase [Salicibibacter kimchii]AXF56249.1 class D sortase [Salicibibacter kimchii]